MTSFSIAADHVLDGCWDVVDQRGTVALRPMGSGGQRVRRPAVFRTRDQADAYARRCNVLLARAAVVLDRQLSS